MMLTNRILIALPNMEHTRSDQYDIFRLDPSGGREQPRTSNCRFRAGTKHPLVFVLSQS